MLKKGQTPAAYLFLAPFLITIGIFFFYAFARAIYYSLTDFNLFNTPKLIGIKPYADVLADPLVPAGAGQQPDLRGHYHHPANRGRAADGGGPQQQDPGHGLLPLGVVHAQHHV